MKVRKKSNNRKKRNKTKIFKDDLWKKKQTLIQKYITNKRYGKSTFLKLDMRSPGENTFNEHDYVDQWNQSDYNVNNLYLENHSFSPNRKRKTSQTYLQNPLKPDFDNNVLAEDPFGRYNNSFNNRIRSLKNFDRTKTISNSSGVRSRPPILNQNKDNFIQATSMTQDTRPSFKKNTGFGRYQQLSQTSDKLPLRHSDQHTASFNQNSLPLDNRGDFMSQDELDKMERDLYRKLGFPPIHTPKK